MNEVDALKKLLEEEKRKNALLNKELKAKNLEIEDMLSNSAYETYRTVIESAKDIIFKTDIQGNFTYVNPAAEASVGYEKDELIGMNYAVIIREDYQERMVDFYANQRDTSLKTSYTEFPVVKKDGSVFWVGQNVQPIFVDGNIVGFNAIARDITEKIIAQKQLEQNEEKYRSIIQNMNLGLLVVDNREVVVDVNPSFLEMMGYTRSELIGKHATTILAPKEKKELLAEVIDRRKKGESNVYELLVNNKKGQDKWMLISGSPVYDTQNKIIGSIGIHLDITDRKQQVAELTKARQKAEESVRSKEMFLANMSHEIRTPMNAIVGMSRLLSEMDAPADQKQYIDSIRISSENLLVIINDILDFSKIDFGKLTLQDAVFPFHSMLANIMLQLSIKAQEKKIKFSKSVDPKVHDFFKADSGRLTQILTNLLGNAIKFTDEGEVSLVCKLIEDAPDKQVVEFRVADTGIGIDKDKLDAVFESFVQENSSISRKYGGTGLGLSISKELVKMFKGDLKVESNKGKGSIFSFQITLVKASKPALETHSQVPNDISALRNVRVLLVEDNKMNQKLAAIHLEKFGTKVTIAENGYQCLELMQKNEYDVVLMDLHMPGVDGFGATYVIRNKLLKNVPIIALTANAISGDKEKCLEAGMNDYISKPFDKNELAVKLMKAISTPKALTLAYDLAKLKEETEGDESFVKSMLELFCELAAATIHNMNDDLAQKQYDRIKEYAHKIKPSVDILAINGLMELTRELEKTSIYDERFFENLRAFTERLSTVRDLIFKNELSLVDTGSV